MKKQAFNYAQASNKLRDFESLERQLGIVKFMPVISMFYGVIVMMYYFDNRRHHEPHIHIKYEDQEAVISIPDGNIIEGELRANKLKLVEAWIEIHQ